MRSEHDEDVDLSHITVRPLIRIAIILLSLWRFRLSAIVYHNVECVAES